MSRRPLFFFVRGFGVRLVEEASAGLGEGFGFAGNRVLPGFGALLLWIED